MPSAQSFLLASQPRTPRYKQTHLARQTLGFYVKIITLQMIYLH